MRLKIQFKGMRHVEARGFEPEPCLCNHQLCAGSFIPTRIGQTSCIWSLAEENKLSLFPVMDSEYLKERLTIEQLILYIIKSTAL